MRRRLEEANRRLREKFRGGAPGNGVLATAARGPLTDEQRYAAEVERMVRMRYSLSDELGLLRQRESKPEEFEAYYAYVEQCKARAKAVAADQTPTTGDEPEKTVAGGGVVLMDFV